VSKYVPGSIRVLINFAHTGILSDGAVTRWKAPYGDKGIRYRSSLPSFVFISPIIDDFLRVAAQYSAGRTPYRAINGTLRN
jgi:hypothetical protein